MEHLIKFVPQHRAPLVHLSLSLFVHAVPRSVFGCGESLLQHLSGGRGLLVDVVLVPTLLVVVTAVAVSVRIAESDIFDIFADQFQRRGGKVVTDFVQQERIASGDDVHQS